MIDKTIEAACARIAELEEENRIKEGEREEQEKAFKERLAELEKECDSARTALAAVEPSIRADERRACAEMVRNWLPIRQEMDSEFAAAMQDLADKMEARRD